MSKDIFLAFFQDSNQSSFFDRIKVEQKTTLSRNKQIPSCFHIAHIKPKIALKQFKNVQLYLYYMVVHIWTYLKEWQIQKKKAYTRLRDEQYIYPPIVDSTRSTCYQRALRRSIIDLYKKGGCSNPFRFKQRHSYYLKCNLKLYHKHLYFTLNAQRKSKLKVLVLNFSFHSLSDLSSKIAHSGR